MKVMICNKIYTENLIHNLYPANTPLMKPDHACVLAECDGCQISHAIYNMSVKKHNFQGKKKKRKLTTKYAIH